MPALFSKPVLATFLALVGTSTALPVVTGNLTEFPWVPCGNKMWCTDMYFCTGIWENLTVVPIPPTATAGFAYAYRTNQSECIPGASPIIRVQPGQIYKITFHNTADMDPAFITPNSTLWNNMQTPTDIPGEMVQWGAMNYPLHTTNLHIHGSHLSGQGDHDNVLRPVLPGQCQTYIYNIGIDTPGGMHIYHPHAHGRVAYQFLGGGYGPFIVDDYDATFQSTMRIGRDLAGKRVDQPVKNFLTYRNLERVLSAYVEFGSRMGNGDANGAKMTMVANQWFRWRILHAKAEGVLGWTVFKDPAGLVMAWNTTTGPKCEVYELANDGVYLSRVPWNAYALNGATSTYQFNVHGAERLELAVRCTTVGNFTIEYDGGPVARVTVLATPKTNPYPATVASPFAAGGTLQWNPWRPVWLQELRQGFPGFAPDAKIVAPRFTFSIGFTGINGVLFDQAPNVPAYRTQFNNSIIYEWDFLNTAVHPMHIHQNHYQIVQPGGCGGLKEGEWYDTVTTDTPGGCLVRYRTVNFTGPLIFHCHVLDHEDMGILGWIDVPFKAPGSFEASPAFSSNTKPGYCCVPRVDKNRQMVCRGVPQCGSNLGVNTCNQPCTVPVNLCPAATPYCSTTGVCFQTVKTNADGSPMADSEATCSSPVYPFVIMGIGLAVAAVSVVVAVCVVRRRGSTYSTILIEEMKHESIHMPTTNTSPFPGHVSPMTNSPFPSRSQS